MINIPVTLLNYFPPSRTALLDGARRGVDDMMLREIAEADYGNQCDEMLKALRPIRDSGSLPAPMDWMLTEVLTLSSLHDPDRPNLPPFQPGPIGVRGHQTRLFACAALLSADSNPGCQFADVGFDSTLANGLASALVVAEPRSTQMWGAFAQFLTWRLSHLRESDDTPLFAVLLLIIATRLRLEKMTERALGEIAEWVLSLDSEFAVPFNSNEAPPQSFSALNGFWQPIAAEFEGQIAAIGSASVRTQLQLCGFLLPD